LGARRYSTRAIKLPTCLKNNFQKYAYYFANSKIIPTFAIPQRDNYFIGKSKRYLVLLGTRWEVSVIFVLLGARWEVSVFFLRKSGKSFALPKKRRILCYQTQDRLNAT
jgi:hypothetical protein